MDYRQTFLTFILVFQAPPPLQNSKGNCDLAVTKKLLAAR